MYFLGILTRNGQMALKVKVNYPHFQYQPRESWDAYLVQMWWILLKSTANYCTDKPNFLEFLVQTAKMTLKVMINDLHFQYQLKVSQNACLVQIWWSKPKCITSYSADKTKFLEFWVKMTLRVKVNDPHFPYQLKVSQDAYLIQIWLFKPKSVTSYCMGKPNFL